MLSWDLANKSDELLEASDVLDKEAVRLRLGVREDAENLLSSVGRVDVGELAIGLARVDGQRAHIFAGHWSLGNQIGQHELESGDVSSWLNRALEVSDILESKFVKQRLLDFDIDYIFVYKVIIYPLQIRLEVSVETEHKALSSSLVSLTGTIWRKIEILLGIFGGGHSKILRSYMLVDSRRLACRMGRRPGRFGGQDLVSCAAKLAGIHVRKGLVVPLGNRSRSRIEH